MIAETSARSCKRPAANFFLDEMLLRDVASRDFLIDEPWQGGRPHGFEFKCSDAFDDVDANGGDPDLKDGVWVFEVI
jgi:hypothetical protein